MLGGGPSEFIWFDWSERWRNRTTTQSRDRMNQRWSVRESLVLAPLPRWSDASPEFRRHRTLAWISAINREGISTFTRVLGVAAVLAPNPLMQGDPATPPPRPSSPHT